jgi:hypothetical protein
MIMVSYNHVSELSVKYIDHAGAEQTETVTADNLAPATEEIPKEPEKPKEDE